MTGTRLSSQGARVAAAPARTVRTAGLLEGEGEPVCGDAQHAYADVARRLGFGGAVHHAAADPAELTDDQVPLAVRRAVADDTGFLAVQPSLVLALGPALPQADTVMFNVHLDTVAGLEPAGFDGNGSPGAARSTPRAPPLRCWPGCARRARPSRPGRRHPACSSRPCPGRRAVPWGCSAPVR